MEEKIREVARLITEAKNIVIFVGAGLSTESGIPDFRSPGGVWDKYDRPISISIIFFPGIITGEILADGTEMYEAMRDAKPNAGHLAIAEA